MLHNACIFSLKITGCFGCTCMHLPCFLIHVRIYIHVQYDHNVYIHVHIQRYIPPGIVWGRAGAGCAVEWCPPAQAPGPCGPGSLWLWCAAGGSGPATAGRTQSLHARCVGVEREREGERERESERERERVREREREQGNTYKAEGAWKDEGHIGPSAQVVLHKLS